MHVWGRVRLGQGRTVGGGVAGSALEARRRRVGVLHLRDSLE